MKFISKNYCCWYCGSLLENTGESYMYRPASFVLRCNNHGKYFVDFCGFENQGLIQSIQCVDVFEKEKFKDRDYGSIPLYYILIVFNLFSVNSLSVYSFIMGDEIELPNFPIDDQPEVIAEKVKNKIKTLIAFV